MLATHGLNSFTAGVVSFFGRLGRQGQKKPLRGGRGFDAALFYWSIAATISATVPVNSWR